MSPSSECLFYKLALGLWVDAPETAFARLLLTAWDFDEVAIKAEIVPDGILPAFVCRAIVRVVFSDVAIDAAECQLFVLSGSDCLHYQLGVRVRRLRVVLATASRYAAPASTVPIIDHHGRYLQSETVAHTRDFITSSTTEFTLNERQ